MRSPSRIYRVGFVLAILLVILGCVPSVHPFYRDKDVLFDHGLLGIWREDDSEKPRTWTFKRDGDSRTYHLEMLSSDGKTGSFRAHLFRLHGDCFLDLIAEESKLAPDQLDVVGASLIPGHLLLRVSSAGETFEVAWMDWDWLTDYLKANPRSLRHMVEDDRPILIAETADLQRFVRRHLKSGKLFKEPTTLRRVSKDERTGPDRAAPP